ncbi:hypothetical protein C8R44DRAFT_747709 [Mycena epipterygia]|nr:hypothetical protein C8R44DRAFT_747709 [Mycena epipterygia]
MVENSDSERRKKKKAVYPLAPQQRLGSNKDLGVRIQLSPKKTPCAHYTTLLSDTRSTADQDGRKFKLREHRPEIKLKKDLRDSQRSLRRMGKDVRATPALRWSRSSNTVRWTGTALGIDVEAAESRRAWKPGRMYSTWMTQRNRKRKQEAGRRK